MNDIQTLTAKELMKALKISEPTLHLLVRNKEIPHFYIGKRILRFNKKLIIAWMENKGAVS
ncbi:MAG: helix-turn-helix domain-containing protein [Treponema sp.]|nr:helix-turn-helix domain-containing protein [Treponema sp.]